MYAENWYKPITLEFKYTDKVAVLGMLFYMDIGCDS